MASLPFSSPLQSLTLFKTVANSYSSWPSMAFFVPSVKSSLGSSTSTFLQHGFSLQSPNFPGFLSKTRPFGVFARAATEKTLHDYTVKVFLLILLRRFGVSEVGSRFKFSKFRNFFFSFTFLD